MTFYESNDEVRPTGVEPDEFVDAPPQPRTERAGEPDEPGSPLDTGNLPGDNRPPTSARPLRDAARREAARGDDARGDDDRS